MIPRRVILLLATTSVALVAAAAGCNLILGTGYQVGSADAAAQPDGVSPDGVAGDACVSNPQNKSGLESACTNAACQPFDNPTRNTRCDGGVACPALPTPDAGGSEAASAADAGASDAADAGHPSDAAPGPEAGPPDAGADSGPVYPSCSTLTQGPKGGAFPQPVVYATGSTAIQPYMARVAQVLETLGIGSLVYLGAGSCLGVQAMLTGQPLQAIGPTATYYDSVPDPSSGNVQSGTCAVDSLTPSADLGISDVFPTTCVPTLATQGGLPNNLHDFFGPVQVMEMVVPSGSHQTSISAEAAYMVWGFGAQSGVTPWNDVSLLLQRSATSGTQNMISAVINVPPGQWQGVHNGSSTSVLTAITNVASGKNIDGGASNNPNAVEETMGILASDVADSNRTYLKPLALQDVGQSCGYYPDSTAASFDKQNVRDGHYPIWGPSHLIAGVNGDNEAKASVKTLIDAMNGQNTQVAATLDIVQFYAKSHIIPTCAMHVQRAQDGHEYEPYAPSTSCSCYYDLQATGNTSCVPCSSDADCKSAPGGATTCVTAFGVQHVGYCEPPGTAQ
jgi:hypothetical protein